MNMNRLLKALGILTLTVFISLGAAGGCNNNGGSGMNGGDELNGGDDMGAATTTLNVFNKGDATTVYAVFSSDSCTKISDWTKASSITCTSGDTTCAVTANSSICSFPIGSMDTCTLPVKSGCLTSINFAFNPLVVTQPCGPTPGTGPSLAEVSINGSDCSKTPGCTTPPCDCVDISLVQGYTLPNISMTLSKRQTKLGPTVGATGNQKVFGVFPVGCTNCLNRAGCPCGIDCTDTSQCHMGGTPNDPEIPCQASQPTGGTITINILAN